MDLEELKAGGKLPSPTGVALSIFRLTRKPDVSLSEISHAVQADPALSGKLIKYANTLKAGSRIIASIPDALNLLGMAATRQIALGFSILNGNRKGECSAFDYSRFWSKCLARAIVAQLLCSRSMAARADECFIGALLSDVGSLALATLHPEAYSDLLRQGLSLPDKIERERALFSTDHLELTSLLLSDWMLPPLFSTIALHQDNPEAMPFSPESREFKLCTLWHFSDMLAEAFLSGERAMVSQMSRLIREARKIGMEPDEFASLCNEAMSSWAEWGKILDVPGKTLPSFEEMMASLPGKEEAELQPMRIVLAGQGGDLADSLSSMGHAVLIGQDIEEALQLVIQADPQVVISTPEVERVSFAKALRAIPSGQQAYLLVLSEDGGDESVISAFRAGADDFLQWPSSVGLLAAHLFAAQRFSRIKESISF